MSECREEGLCVNVTIYSTEYQEWPEGNYLSAHQDRFTERVK